MADVVLRNESKNEFTDISSEQMRTYVFPAGEKIVISEPQFLSVGRSGHRLLDGEGNSHYVPSGWLHLYWKVKEGQPHFVR